jgi:hypothetical protein
VIRRNVLQNGKFCEGVWPGSRSLLASLRNGPGSDQIAVLHWPHIVEIQGRQRLSFSGCGNELKLQTIPLVNLHHGCQIPVAKTMRVDLG